MKPIEKANYKDSYDEAYSAGISEICSSNNIPYLFADLTDKEVASLSSSKGEAFDSWSSDESETLEECGTKYFVGYL